MARKFDYWVCPDCGILKVQQTEEENKYGRGDSVCHYACGDFVCRTCGEKVYRPLTNMERIRKMDKDRLTQFLLSVRSELDFTATFPWCFGLDKPDRLYAKRTKIEIGEWLENVDLEIERLE